MSDDDADTLKALTLELLDRSPENPITAAELARRVGIEDGGGSPATREAIKELIEKRNVPIASNGNGYFLIQSEAQHNRYQRSLDQRIEGIIERKRITAEAWENFKNEQAETGEREVLRA